MECVFIIKYMWKKHNDPKDHMLHYKREPFARCDWRRSLMIFSAPVTMRVTSSRQLGMSSMRPITVPADHAESSVLPVS